ncbi:MAG: OmpH family outer membrane protein [bacterium]|nr:MAG: OmpH family outer membrane protein [bacterium]
MIFRNLPKAFFILSLILIIAAPGFGQKLKIGYIHSQKILADYKEAQDAQKKLDEINRQWEDEGLEMQQRLQQLREQYDAQSLLLSEAKKREKEQEIQNLFLQLQKFQRDKWDPQSGEILKKQAELIQPVYDKINAVIKKIGEEEKFDYIFDTANGGILHAGADQPDLTDRVLEELNKGQSVKAESSKDKGR